jgi:hypothetical protein
MLKVNDFVVLTEKISGVEENSVGLKKRQYPLLQPI